ncbi:hypothetical protein [Desulfovibrio litoralis]|uniref:Rod shape-determining protein MreD n=1 Tax=Desulfovibrio litoralis DSM 11393 TaxID=1121455 RepID=A0A1M7S8B0_9BACT|nr:hypothetical protein [Desulfovibrio litoralis]SHN54673.1 hypothetical protein SAMN02745728_00569 [Desulfovibrio litoralis DSM 11393]
MWLLNILWWCFFIVIGVFIQAFIPGIDALVPGVIVSLYEKRWQQTFWLCLVFILIQEGTSSLVFGAAPLWYITTIVMFILGQRLFNANNFFFILCFGAILSLVRILIVLLIMQVGTDNQDYKMFFNDAIWQTFIFSLVWCVASRLRKILPQTKKTDNLYTLGN